MQSAEGGLHFLYDGRRRDSNGPAMNDAPVGCQRRPGPADPLLGENYPGPAGPFFAEIEPLAQFPGAQNPPDSFPGPRNPSFSAEKGESLLLRYYIAARRKQLLLCISL